MNLKEIYEIADSINKSLTGFGATVFDVAALIYRLYQKEPFIVGDALKMVSGLILDCPKSDERTSFDPSGNEKDPAELLQDVRGQFGTMKQDTNSTRSGDNPRKALIRCTPYCVTKTGETQPMDEIRQTASRLDEVISEAITLFDRLESIDKVTLVMSIPKASRLQQNNDIVGK